MNEVRRHWLAEVFIVLLVAGFALLPGGQAAGAPGAGGTELWEAFYNGPGGVDDDYAQSAAASPDGSRVFVTGSSWDGSGGSDDYATLAYDAATGSQAWLARYNGPANGSNDFASFVAVSPDGSKVFVTGDSTGLSGPDDYSDYATVAYAAATGSQLWVRRYNGSGKYFDEARSMAVSPDGSKVFITGYSFGATSSYDYATVAYAAATGAVLWVRRYNGPGNNYDSAFSVAASPDGSKVLVTGASTGTTSSEDYATLAYDASTGANLWVSRYNGPGNGDDEAKDLGVSPDGSTVFVTGCINGCFLAESSDYGTVAYAASTGSQLWARGHNGPGNGEDEANALAVSPDGSTVFVTGFSLGATTHNDYATAAYEATTGSVLWARRFNDPGDFNDVAVSVAASPDGSKVFVIGYFYPDGFYSQFGAVAYGAASGARLWGARWSGFSEDDFPTSLAVSPDGSKVFVTGWREDAGGPANYATVALQA
jgi:hypothetical protein